MVDKFQFYSKSADKKPGKGVGESGDPENYAELGKIKNWRHELSNFSDSCIVSYDNLSFRTIEHAFHYAKCALINKEKAKDFSLESGTDLSRGSGLDARGARKLVKLSEPDLKVWADKKSAFLKYVWEQKANQSKKFRDVLLATKQAELWHYLGRGLGVERWLNLELIRNGIKDSH